MWTFRPHTSASSPQNLHHILLSHKMITFYSCPPKTPDSPSPLMLFNNCMLRFRASASSDASQDSIEQSPLAVEDDRRKMIYTPSEELLWYMYINYLFPQWEAQLPPPSLLEQVAYVSALPFCTLVGLVTPNSLIYQMGVVFSTKQLLFLLLAQALLHPDALLPAEQWKTGVGKKKYPPSEDEARGDTWSW